MGAPLALTATALLVHASALAQAPEPTQPGQRGQPGVSGKEALPAPPPHEPVAGLYGFESLSSLVYAAAPEHPHELQATYVFPKRVRWMVSVRAEKGLERTFQYRSGESVYVIPVRTNRSEERDGDERLAILLAMELRRALMLFPDGFAWQADGDERTAKIEGLGLLRARFAADPVSPSAVPDLRPYEVAASDAGGKPVETFKAISWREIGGRKWPASMEMWQAGELVWKETVSSVQTGARYIDAYFSPPDRRDSAYQQVMGGPIRQLEIPALCALRVELEAGATWGAAIEELSRQKASWVPRLSAQKIELDPHAMIEVSPDGRPSACLLRLAVVPEKPPAGFELVPSRKGVALPVKGLAQATASRLAELSRSLAPETVADRPYVKFLLPDAEAGHVLVVLPYSARHQGR